MAKGLTVSVAAFGVTDEAAVTSAIRRTELEIGLIGILINNASMQFRTPLEDFPLEKWRELILHVDGGITSVL